MKRLSLFLVAMLLATTLVSAAEKPAVSSSQEPEIKVSEESLKKDVEADDEGLTRLGNFGKLHLFGYGELHYNGLIGDEPNQIDFHRMVIGVGYDFTDRIKMRTEVDFEHAFKEPELEFAYLDFLYKPSLNFRAGSILVPMGVLNQHHEPPLFNSVERPEVYRGIIPTSWQEGGAGLHGKLPAGFDYELYMMSSLEAVTIEDGAVTRGFTGDEGFHDSFGHVGEQVANNFAAAGRLQYKGSGLRVGHSFFLGNTGQGNPSIGSAFLAMLEGDAKYSFEGIDLEGLVVFTNLSDAGNINNTILTVDPTFTNFVGSQMLGWYLEGAYHVLHHILPNTSKDLIFFVRHERVNTQYKMPSTFAGDPVNGKKIVTLGVSYLPIPQIAIKADYTFRWNNVNADVDQVNFGVGFYY